MTSKNDHLKTTAGVSADAKPIDTPLATSGPRDALTDFNPAVDIVPGMEDKGYHVGMVRQPAEVVGTNGRPEGFRSTTDAPSKFAGTDLKASKAAHNAREAKLGDKLGVPPSPDPMPAGAFVPGLGFVPYDAAEEPETPAKPKRSRSKKTTDADTTGDDADAGNGDGTDDSGTDSDQS